MEQENSLRRFGFKEGEKEVAPGTQIGINFIRGIYLYALGRGVRHGSF
jgi:hypothetical protein